MNKPLKINSSYKIDYNIDTTFKPELVYIPLENRYGNTYKYLVKEGDYVYKGQVVAINKYHNFPIHSSVSGYAVCGSNKIISNGKKIKCVVIENDFKEKIKIVKVDVESEPALLQKFKITAVPTLIFLKDFKEIERIQGAQSKAALIKYIQKLI